MIHGPKSNEETCRHFSAKEFLIFAEAPFMRRAFEAKGFLHLKAVLPRSSLDYLKNKVSELMPFAHRKDFLMPQSGYSPRHMDVIGGAVMNRQSGIVSLYNDAWLLRMLSEITNLEVCICEEQIENIIATVMRYPGDTHGWHVDDFPLAFVIALEMPRPGDGGELELRYSANEVRRVVLDEGDAYILRSDRIAHRVIPLTNHSARTIVNFTYSTVGMQVIPNGTAPLLCTKKGQSGRRNRASLKAR